MKISGKVSHFGGPGDSGVSPSEGLAFIYKVEDAPHLFLPAQPPGTTGLARRLDPAKFYLACRWDYNAESTSKTDLLKHTALVRAPKTGLEFEVYPADWGPHSDTGRVADISPGLMGALGITTDDTVEVLYPYKAQEEEEEEEGTAVAYGSIVISSGHGKYVRGASGVLDEVDEARRVTDRLAGILRERGVKVKTFHDDTSRDQNTNLKTIVNYHNAQTRDLDISVHFNAYVETDKPMGVEVLYVTQSALAGDLSAGIASCGFTDRGGKKRTDLYFLNNTKMPAVLIEVCFVDSTADAKLYREQFEAVCKAIAGELAAPNGARAS
jgi:N-acetylmuramoyl-L-alanine amidase